MRQAAHSMVAMWQAAHNTDYYITKYGTKALEQLQHLIGQFALGLRRLEVQEQQEIEQQRLSVEPNDYKQRARESDPQAGYGSEQVGVGILLRNGFVHPHKSSCPKDLLS